jgi:hypothetical protein
MDSLMKKSVKNLQGMIYGTMHISLTEVFLFQPAITTLVCLQMLLTGLAAL